MCYTALERRPPGRRRCCMCMSSSDSYLHKLRVPTACDDAPRTPVRRRLANRHLGERQRAAIFQHGSAAYDLVTHSSRGAKALVHFDRDARSRWIATEERKSPNDIHECRDGASMERAEIIGEASRHWQCARDTVSADGHALHASLLEAQVEDARRLEAAQESGCALGFRRPLDE